MRPWRTVALAEDNGLSGVNEEKCAAALLFALLTLFGSWETWGWTASPTFSSSAPSMAAASLEGNHSARHLAGMLPVVICASHKPWFDERDDVF